MSKLTEVYKKVSPACIALVIVEEKGSSIKFQTFGSGVCIDPLGTVITTRHVITEYYRIFEGQEIPKRPEETTGSFKQIPPRFQIVFLQKGLEKFEARYTHPGPMLHSLEENDPYGNITVMQTAVRGHWPYMPLASLTDEVLHEGIEVATLGYPLNGVQPTLSKGIISKIEGHFVKGSWETTRAHLNIKVNPGNNGGPVFNPETGEIWGVVHTEHSEDSFLKDALCIPLSTIYRILNSFQKIKEKTEKTR